MSTFSEFIFLGELILKHCSDFASQTAWNSQRSKQWWVLSRVMFTLCLHLHLVILQMLLSKATHSWGIHKAIHLEEVKKKNRGSAHNTKSQVLFKYKLAREGEKDYVLFVFNFVRLGWSQVMLKEMFSVVAWRLTGIQHSGWGWEDHSTGQERWKRMFWRVILSFSVMVSRGVAH